MKSNYFIIVLCIAVYLALIVAFLDVLSFIYQIIIGSKPIYGWGDIQSVPQIVILFLSLYAAYGLLIFVKFIVNQFKTRKTKNGK